MNYKAKKKFGQNFLKDESYLAQIIESIPKTQLQMIEIGVGLGDLTDRLIKLHNLIAYEVDEDLCSLLSDRHQETLKQERLKLICCDVMELQNKIAWLHPKPYFLVSNLPYYIATHIVLRLLRDSVCRGFLVMTQKEVAEKFCASERESEFCALSVIAQSVGKVEYLFDVPASAFEPAPKVVSAVFRLNKAEDQPSLESLATMEGLLRVAFASPRKKLVKNLLQVYPKQKIEEVFASLHIEEKARPHEVSTSLYHQLAKKLNERGNNG